MCLHAIRKSIRAVSLLVGVVVGAASGAGANAAGRALCGGESSRRTAVSNARAVRLVHHASRPADLVQVGDSQEQPSQVGQARLERGFFDARTG